MSKREDFFSDIIIGMSDGLIVPFALVAGLSHLTGNISIIIIAGVIAVIGGAIAMSIGGYGAARSGGDHHHDHEAESLELLKEKQFLANIGLTEEMQQKALDEMKKDNDLWASFVSKYEDNMQTGEKATRSAINIGISYLAGGLIPLVPYFFIALPMNALKITIIITLFSLFIFGYLKGRITGRPPFATALRVMVAGALAAGCAYGVAGLVERI